MKPIIYSFYKKTLFKIICATFATLLFSHTSYTKDFVNGCDYTRAMSLSKEIAKTLDEVRWSEGDLLSTPSTISNPGYYILCFDIDGTITIDSDNVCLDLNGYKIYDTEGTNTLITINSNHKNVVIKNGTVKGIGSSGSTVGIELQGGCALIQIEEVRIYDCYTGIYFNGTSEGTIRGCNIRDCLLDSCYKGAVLNYAIKNDFEKSKLLNCQRAGFELTNCDLNLFEYCYVLKTINNNATESAIAFCSTDGESNVFKDCIVDGVYKTESDFNYNAIGFLLKDTEMKTKIVDCVITKCICSGDATSYGIQLDFSLNNNALASALYTGDLADNEVLCVDWSPESRFVAIGGKDNIVRIFSFDGSTLTPITQVTPNGQDINCLAWSPDGTYLAVGTNKDLVNKELFVYLFDSSPFDPDEIITLTSSRHVADHVYSVDWSPNSRFLAIGVDNSIDYEIQVWGFNGSDLSEDAIYTANKASNVLSVAFSPDGKYLAAAYSTQVEIFAFDPTIDLILTSKDLETAYGGTLKSVDWSPLICGSRYYVAASGARASNITTRVFQFESETLTSIATADHGADINANKWSPNGKYLFVGGATSGTDELRIYTFDPSATVGSRLVSTYAGSHCSTPVHALDWSPCAKFVISVGCETTNDTCIFDVATVPNRCVIENNEIADSQIGIEGSSNNHLIIRNIGYYNKINFSESIFNQFRDGLNQNPTNIHNISIPPQYYPIFKPDETGDGGCDSHDDYCNPCGCGW